MKRVWRIWAGALSLLVVLAAAGCGRQGSDASFTQVVNPIHEVESVRAMEEMLGYTIPVLDREVETYIVLVIDGKAESGRIRYADGTDFNIKKGTGDISGIYGGEPAGEERIEGVSVAFFTFEDLRYAIWENDGFAFSLTGGDMLRDDVTALIQG